MDVQDEAKRLWEAAKVAAAALAGIPNAGLLLGCSHPVELVRAVAAEAGCGTGWFIVMKEEGATPFIIESMHAWVAGVEVSMQGERPATPADVEAKGKAFLVSTNRYAEKGEVAAALGGAA